MGALWHTCHRAGVLGLEQHGGQSYGLYFIFLAFMYVLRCISLNINSQHGVRSKTSYRLWQLAFLQPKATKKQAKT